jgi:hypothetical protein
MICEKGSACSASGFERTTDFGACAEMTGAANGSSAIAILKQRLMAGSD